LGVTFHYAACKRSTLDRIGFKTTKSEGSSANQWSLLRVIWGCATPAATATVITTATVVTTASAA
jgi:hypothetical protein